MHLHYLQNIAFEDAAHVAVWADNRGHDVTCTRLDRGEKPPSVEAFDMLAVMGGPMNIYEEQRYPWLAVEKRFLREAIDAGKTILGVCLGAQLLADVLGGPVRKNRVKEIGWYGVRLTDDGERHPLLDGLPRAFPAMHWHGDTFAIPPGATHLASSEACTNQAFAHGDRILGLQFHIDYTAQSIENMLRHCGDELAQGPFTQDVSAIRLGYPHVDTTTELLERVLDNLSLRL